LDYLKEGEGNDEKVFDDGCYGYGLMFSNHVLCTAGL